MIDIEDTEYWPVAYVEPATPDPEPVGGTCRDHLTPLALDDETSEWYCNDHRLAIELRERLTQGSYGLTLTETGHTVTVSSAPKSLATLYGELLLAGWELEPVRKSQTLETLAPFASGTKLGQSRPDRKTTWYGLQGLKGVAKFVVSYKNTGFLDALVSDPVNGVTSLKTKTDFDEWRRVF